MEGRSEREGRGVNSPTRSFVSLYQRGDASIYDRPRTPTTPQVAPADFDRGGQWSSDERSNAKFRSDEYDIDPNARRNSSPIGEVRQRRANSDTSISLTQVQSNESNSLTDEERNKFERKLLAGPENGKVVKWMKRLVFVPAAAASISEALFSSSFVARIANSLWLTIPTAALSFSSNTAIRTIALNKTIDQVSTDLGFIECKCRPRHRERHQPYAHFTGNERVLDHSDYYDDDDARLKKEFTNSTVMETFKLGAISALGAAPDFALAKYSLFKPGALDWMPKGLKIFIIAIVLPNRVITSLALGFRGVAGSRVYTYKLFTDKHIRKKAIEIRKIVIDYYSKMLALDSKWVPSNDDCEYLSQGFTTRPSILIEMVSAATILTYSIVSYKSAMGAWSCDGLSYYPQAFCEFGLDLAAFSGFTRKYLLLLSANRAGWNRVFAKNVNIFPAEDISVGKKRYLWFMNGVGAVMGFWTTTGPAEMILNFVFDGVDTPATKIGSFGLAGIAVFWINGFDFVVLTTEDIPRMINEAKARNNRAGDAQPLVSHKPINIVKAITSMRDRPLYEFWMRHQSLFRKMKHSAKENRVEGVRLMQDFLEREHFEDDIELDRMERADRHASVNNSGGTLSSRARPSREGYADLDRPSKSQLLSSPIFSSVRGSRNPSPRPSVVQEHTNLVGETETLLQEHEVSVSYQKGGDVSVDFF